MIGLIIGGVTALVIIVFYGKDEKAVREYKEELKKIEQDKL
jgi:hypothetical protein